jgi:acyl carrier protein
MENITLDTMFDSLGMDSLDKLELLTAIEDELDIRIPDDRMQGIVSIESLIELLVELQQKPPETLAQSHG